MSRIIYVQYTNPAGYPPLEHSSKILAEAGAEVLFLGTGAFGAASLRLPWHPRITVRQLSFRSAGFRQKLHYAWFCLWCMGWALRWRPRWVYASDPLSCPVALLLNILLRLQLVYHEHDSPSSQPSSYFARLCLSARIACARRAFLCILPNQERANRFLRDTESKRSVKVVWNCPSRDEVIPNPRQADRSGLRLLYHGSIVPERLPLTLVEALAELPQDVTLRIVGYETVGSGGYLSTLKREAERFGVATRIRVIGTLPRRIDMLEVCRDSDVGLALLLSTHRDFNLQAMTGASNKPFDYLACGIPVLVSNLPDWRDVFVSPRYGLCCDPSDPQSIAGALRWFVNHRVETRQMGDAGQRRIVEDWHYEATFRPVFDQLTRESMR